MTDPHLLRRISGIGPGEGALPPAARLRSDAAVRVLDGIWRFRYAPDTASALDDPAGVPDDDRGWSDLPVPSMWQLHGYGAPIYTSSRFPFPVDPPAVPDANGIGDHRLVFDADEALLHGAVLRFDGIDSVGVVRLNGALLGTTAGSRNTHSFDVTDVLRPIGNRLDVRVAQWSANSYLEDQDMWWLSGVFRSVALIERPRGGVDDVHVVADLDPTTEDGTMTVEVRTRDGAAARWRLPELGLEGAAGPAPVAVPRPEPWTAETPRLYDLEVATPAETVRLRIGFRRVAIEDGLLRVNGVPIRFRGVNRHDHDAHRGRAVDETLVRDDLLRMKRHGVNAIRTSHYPPPPALLELADELGFWVIEECDLETHGFQYVDFRGNPVDDDEWRTNLVDRLDRMVLRDRNHPSVVVWSLGNESGTGRNLAAMRAAAMEADGARPIHYERDPSYADSDLHSRMYTPHDLVERIGRTGDVREDAVDPGLAAKPFILCEYAHAMGTGPGGLSEYEALFDRWPRLQGGFVWEWVEHGLATVSPSGRPRLGYGGDFGEAVHDGAFAADGVLAPDRRERPGLADLGAVFAPFRVEVQPDGRAVRVANRHDFLSAEYFALACSIVDLETGDALAAWRQALPDIAPGSVVELPLQQPDGVCAPGASVLTASIVRLAGTAWAGSSEEVAWGQQVHEGGPRAAPEPADTGDLELDPTSGALRRIGDVAVRGPTVALWRAPTDNDVGANMARFGVESDAVRWDRLHLRALQTRVLGVDRAPGRTVVRTRSAPPGSDGAVDAELRWTPVDGGAALTAAFRSTGHWNEDTVWARLGIDLELPDDRVDRVVWTGRGPYQAYPDTGQGARLGVFTRTPHELHEPYLRPQENGSRGDVTRLRIEYADGRVLEVRGGPFAFTLRPWTAHELDAAAHEDELPETGRLVLGLDVARHGVGTGACGPGVLPAYRLRPRSGALDVVLRSRRPAR